MALPDRLRPRAVPVLARCGQEYSLSDEGITPVAYGMMPGLSMNSFSAVPLWTTSCDEYDRPVCWTSYRSGLSITFSSVRPMRTPPKGLLLVLLAAVPLGCDADQDTSSGRDGGSGGGTENTGAAACVAAGGRCIVGSGPCLGTIGPENCNPDRNPAGEFCCLPCTSGQVPADGGLPATGCR